MSNPVVPSALQRNSNKDLCDCTWQSLWARDNSISSVEEGDAFYHAKLNFLKDHVEEALVGSWEFTGRSSIRELADKAARCLDQASPLTAIFGNHVLLTGVHNGHRVMVCVLRRRGDEEEYTDWQRGKDFIDGDPIRTLDISVIGHRDVVAHVLNYLRANAQIHKLAAIKWWYRGDCGVGSTVTYLDPLKTVLRPEFYPDMAEHPAVYLRRYLESDAAVLLMAGPPGTGKTTMLRHLICDHNLSAHVVYDEHLMMSDQVFQKFLFGDGDILIVEDADVVLSARSRNDNKLMARFLNVSDGLIKLPNKKVVFTTNISDFGQIDEALLRPGRCFDVLHTRPLNLSEAQAAANVANLPVPTEKREYTVAELFNQGQRVSTASRRIGFGR